MRFLETLVLKQDVDKKLMINEINFSMFDSPYTSNNDKVDNGVSRSSVLEPTVKHLMKETKRFSRTSRNLVKREKIYDHKYP